MVFYFGLAFLGRTIDPRSGKDDAMQAAGYISRFSYDAVTLPYDVGRSLLSPIQTAKALAAIPGMISSGKMKCLLGDKWDEFQHASAFDQGGMIADVFFQLALAADASAGLAGKFRDVLGLSRTTGLAEDASRLRTLESLLDDSDNGGVASRKIWTSPTDQEQLKRIWAYLRDIENRYNIIYKKGIDRSEPTFMRNDPTQQKLGWYNFRYNQVELYQGANLSTLFEELTHARQFLESEYGPGDVPTSTINDWHDEIDQLYLEYGFTPPD